MTSRKASVKKSEALVKKYAPLFGMGHYKVSITPIDVDEIYWGRSHVDHNEEYLDIQIVPDGTLTDEEQAHLILHELSHCLLEYAGEGDSNLETVCNRIPKLILGQDVTGPNYGKFGGPERPWKDDATSRKEWAGEKDEHIAKILSSLPDLSARERYVLGAIYIQGLTFREVAKQMGVSARTVTRIRDGMVRKLSEVV